MILVTGATGKTGSVAALGLAARGARVRALVRNPVRDEALRAAGVRHLIKLSSMEAVPGAKNPVHQTHLQVEDRIRHSGLAWTMIRPNFYMQNFLGSAATIRAQGKFFLPFGAGHAALTDARDAGEAIAHVATTAGHERQSYDITGPEVLSFGDVAERFSEILGRPVEYVNLDRGEYRRQLGQVLKNSWHLDAVCDIFAEIADGYVAPVSGTFAQLIGRTPRDLRQFIRDHLAAFR